MNSAVPKRTESIPRSFERLPIYYGWVIVVVCCVASFLGAGLNNVTVGVVLKPMSEDLGWSRTLAAGAITIGTFSGALLIPVFGRLTDKFGARLLLSGGALLVALSSIGVALAYEPIHFYAMYVPGRALASATLVGVIPITTVTNWFFIKRARAIGIVNMSLQFGSSFITLLYQFLIVTSGWRSTFSVLGVLIIIFVVVPGFWLLRKSAEDVGLPLDGVDPATASATKSTDRNQKGSAAEEYSWTLHDAMRTKALWLVISTFTIAVIGGSGIAFHMVAYFTDIGIDSNIAAMALALYAFCGAVASGVWGYLAERFTPRQLTSVAFISAALAILGYTQVRTPEMALIMAALGGFSARGLLALMHLVLAWYFGRRSYGAISGLNGLFQQSAGGVGPLLAAAAFDLTGSYQGIFMLFAATYFVAAMLILIAKPPVPPTHVPETSGAA